MFIFKMFRRSTCAICNRKIKPLQAYVNDKGETINVCLACSEYAERRAFMKKR